jgi:hypothetical protein
MAESELVEIEEKKTDKNKEGGAGSKGGKGASSNDYSRSQKIL